MEPMQFEPSAPTEPPMIAKPVSLPPKSEADELFAKHMYAKSKKMD